MKSCLSTLLALLALPAMAAISVQDGSGHGVTLQRPAQRIITLAPHATENVFAAGGGERIVGTLSYSDYPPPARAIPRIGDSSRIDLERLLALKPDLLVVWLNGNPESQLQVLRRLGIPVYQSDPHALHDIPAEIENLGRLMGTEASAGPAAAAMRRRLAELAARFRERTPVRLFYQVDQRPLYTLNGRQIVSDAIQLCGGVNVFADLPALAPSVSTEAVLQAQPQAIVAGRRGPGEPDPLEMWRHFTAVPAVRDGNLFLLDSELVARAGPRMLDGAAMLCERLDEARQRLRR